MRARPIDARHARGEGRGERGSKGGSATPLDFVKLLSKKKFPFREKHPASIPCAGCFHFLITGKFPYPANTYYFVVNLKTTIMFIISE